MKQKSYLVQLSSAARWCLPPEEAEEVTADYRDMLAQDARSYEELRRDVGSPWQAVRQVCPPKTYARWLVVFGILAAGLILPVAAMFIPSLWEFFWIDLGGLQMQQVFLGVGLILSLLWFQFQGVREKPLSKVLPLLMALIVALLIGVSVCAAHFYFTLTTLIIPLNMVGRVASLAYELTAAAAAIAGIYGLVKARLGDRRWRALYVLGLTVVVLCVSVLLVLWSMDVTDNTNWELRWLQSYLLTAAVGLVGTGISLC